MVSAVFHSPREASVAKPTGAAVAMSSAAAVQPKPKPSKPAYDWRGLWLKVLPPFVGIGLLIGI